MKKAGKVLAFCILSLFMISFFVGVVSAAWNVKDTFVDTFSKIFSGDFKTFKDFLVNVLSPEILFGLLIFLIIFAVVSQISLFGPTWIKISVSVIVAILAGGFIDVRVLQPILNQYTALGILISFYLPFILIFYFLKEIAPQNSLVGKFVWIGYAIIMGINAFINWDRLTGASKPLYIIVIIAAVVMAFIWMWIMKKLLINEIKDAIENNSKQEKFIASRKVMKLEEVLNEMNDLPEGQREYLRKEIAKIKENIAK
jgi:hypothetical protein